MAGQPEPRAYRYRFLVPQFSSKQGAEFRVKVSPSALAGDMAIVVYLDRIAEVWIGLAKRLPFGSPQALADFDELFAKGYARKHLTQADWRVEGDCVVCKTFFFENRGQAKPWMAGQPPPVPAPRWPVVRAWFMASTPDDTGMLLGWHPLGAPRSLMVGDGLELRPIVPLTTRFKMEVSDAV